MYFFEYRIYKIVKNYSFWAFESGAYRACHQLDGSLFIIHRHAHGRAVGDRCSDCLCRRGNRQQSSLPRCDISTDCRADFSIGYRSGVACTPTRGMHGLAYIVRVQLLRERG